MNKEQIKDVKKLIGKMDGRDIAKELGVSLSNIKRAFRGTRLAFHNKYVLNPDLVKRVCKYYEKHGRPKTQKRFPEISVRSIVERYKWFNPRCIRWTDKEIVELAKMAGLVRMDHQAEYFKRPRANAGSIQSAWMKKFGVCGGSINGMSEFMAREIVTEKCPRLKTEFYQARRKGQFYYRSLCLWVDMEKNIKKQAPKFITDAVKQMAAFQRWLHNTKNPKPSILKMMKERGEIS